MVQIRWTRSTEKLVLGLLRFEKAAKRTPFHALSSSIMHYKMGTCKTLKNRSEKMCTREEHGSVVRNLDTHEYSTLTPYILGPGTHWMGPCFQDCIRQDTQKLEIATKTRIISHSDTNSTPVSSTCSTVPPPSFAARQNPQYAQCPQYAQYVRQPAKASSSCMTTRRYDAPVLASAPITL